MRRKEYCKCSRKEIHRYERRSKSINFGWIMLAIALAVVLGVLVDDSFEEDYKIYQNVCRNESISVHYNFPDDFNKTKCIVTSIEEVPCYDSKGNEIINLKCKDGGKQIGDFCYVSFDNKYTLIQNINDGYHFTYYLNSNFINQSMQFYASPEYVSQYMPEKTQEYKQVCEDVEVKNMTTNKICFFRI